jgi:putative ABC transport system permease protein
MRPLGILHLYRVRLRARFVQELLAVTGIAVGVALLFASQVANTSLAGSVAQLTGGLVGQSRLELAARGSEGFDARLLQTVQRLPGVLSAAPVLQAQANVLGPRGSEPVTLVGADPRFVRLGGTLLQHFSASALARQRAIALPTPVARAIGASSLQVIKLQVGASTVPVLLGITLGTSDVGALVYSPVALAPLAYAQQLTGMRGRISRIFVVPRRGQDAAVRAALRRLAAGRLNVDPASHEATLFDSAATPTNQSTALFAAISALVGFIFAFNAMLLTVPARRALINDLRLDGYSPWTVLQVLLFDAFVLGVTACALGLALGDELSLRLFHGSPGYLSFAFAVGSQRIVTWQSVALAIMGGMLAACVGVLAPLREVFEGGTARLRRPAGGRRAGRSWLALLSGIGCLALSGAILVLAPRAAVVGIVSLTAAMLALLPVLLRGLLAFVERLTEGVPARAPFVAVAELRSMWPRTVGIAATGAIAVFGSVAIQGAHADLQHGLDQSAGDVSGAADVWVVPPGLSNLLATAPFHTGAEARLARLPGVRSVGVYRGGFLDYGDRRVWVSAQPRTQRYMVYPHQIVLGSLVRAEARVRGGGWAVVSRAIAGEHHLRIGSTFTLASPVPERFRVAALSTNVGWPPGAIMINAEDYARGWGSADASAYEIAVLPGHAPAAVRAEVRSALGPASGLSVETRAQREAKQRAASRQGLSRLSQISTLVLIAAVLAMAAAMGNMIWQRRARLARLKLDGFSDLSIWRTLLLESVLLVGSGCAIGAVFGLGGELLAVHALRDVTGFPVVFSLGLPLALGSLALVTTVAVAIAAVPGYLVARVRPAAGLSG